MFEFGKHLDHIFGNQNYNEHRTNNRIQQPFIAPPRRPYNIQKQNTEESPSPGKKGTGGRDQGPDQGGGAEPPRPAPPVARNYGIGTIEDNKPHVGDFLGNIIQTTKHYDWKDRLEAHGFARPEPVPIRLPERDPIENMVFNS